MNGGSLVQVAGAGGHAKVVIATLRAAGFEVGAAWDDDPGRVGGSVLGVPIVGPIGDIPRGAVVVIAVGSNAGRKAVAVRLEGREFIRAVHPSAIVDASVALGPGSVVFAGAVVQPDARVQEHVIVNTGAHVDHDCLLEDFVHVAPGVNLAGNVCLREGAFLGTGSCAVPGVEVGEWATVGAGGVVVKSIHPRETALGCPARPRRRPMGEE